MRGPQVCVITDGEILLEAATVPAADAVAEMFKTLLRARQAQFDAMQGVENPDAWSHSAGALQPGGREFTHEEFEAAYARWRKQWIQRINLTPKQEEQKNTLSASAFHKKARSWFEAWLHRYIGDRHVARAIVRYGIEDPTVVVRLKEQLDLERQTEKQKADDDNTHGVSESVNTVDGGAEPAKSLRKTALKARYALRQAQSLQRKLDSDEISWYYLSQQQRELLDQLVSRKLHVNVDKANKAYGHGIARTNDFGFAEVENMCRNVPMDVRAQLRLLQGNPPGLIVVA